MPTRAVFDTNILISAQLSPKGRPFHCVALARDGFVQSVTCQPILDELAEKLITKFKAPGALAAEVVEHIRGLSEVVVVPTIPTAVSRDKDDDIVLACAVVGHADYISYRRQRFACVGQLPKHSDRDRCGVCCAIHAESAVMRPCPIATSDTPAVSARLPFAR